MTTRWIMKGHWKPNIVLPIAFEGLDGTSPKHPDVTTSPEGEIPEAVEIEGKIFQYHPAHRHGSTPTYREIDPANPPPPLEL